jgi:hypothetical protein
MAIAPNVKIKTLAATVVKALCNSPNQALYLLPCLDGGKFFTFPI